VGGNSIWRMGLFEEHKKKVNAVKIPSLRENGVGIDQYIYKTSDRKVKRMEGCATLHGPKGEVDLLKEGKYFKATTYHSV